MIHYCLTDIGKKREINEDYLYASDSAVGPLPNLYIVCDGMGGANAGEYASEYTTRGVIEALEQMDFLGTVTDPKEAAGALNEAITAANDTIYDRSQTDPDKRGMGTTIVAVTILGDHMVVANVGDSRCYGFSQGDLKQISLDHSYVEEMVRRGEMTPEMARVSKFKNRITRAIGAEPSVLIDFFDVDISAMDKVLLCSDGLTNMLTDSEIEEILDDGTSVRRQSQLMVERALNEGGIDNVTVIVAEMV